MPVSETTAPPGEVLCNRHRDPYPYFAWLREHAPVFEEIKPNGLSVWQVSRYTDVQALLADARLSKRPDKALAPPAAHAAGLHSHLLHTDPPQHARFRRLTNQAFTPYQVAALAPLVRGRAAELIDALPASGTVDLVAAFAFPLAFTTICAVLGVPQDQRTDRFREVVATTLLPGHVKGRPSQVKLRTHLAALVQHKRRQEPPDGLLGALVLARDNGDHLTGEELVSTAYLFLTVGHDAMMNLIGNGMLALLRHPGQLGRLRYCPALLPVAVDELLRYDGPFRKATFRAAAETIRMGGAVIPRGGVVNLIIGSANRDGGHFERADELDITRRPNDHLSFGRGPHHCVGAELARQVAEIAIGPLIERLDLRLAVADAALRWKPSQLMRGLVELPVSYRKL